MALLHPQADLRPSKLELLTDWLPTRSWYHGPTRPELSRVGSFRFDDPDGEVGIETILIRVDKGLLMQTPLTYRGEPLDGGEEYFIGNSDHSVLGQRWIYDACGDPLYARVLAMAILTGATQADEFNEIDGQAVPRKASVFASGSGRQAEVPNLDVVVGVDDGDPTRIRTGSVDLAVLRVLGDARTDEPLTLTATWSGQATPVLLAFATQS
jgi:hypothetical protein